MKLKEKLVELWNRYSVYVAAFLTVIIISAVVGLVLFPLQFIMGANVSYLQCFFPLVFIFSGLAYLVIQFKDKIF